MLSKFPPDINKEEFIQWVKDSASSQKIGLDKALNWSMVFKSKTDFSLIPNVHVVVEERIKQFKRHKKLD